MTLKSYPIALGPLVAQVIALRARREAIDVLLKSPNHRRMWTELYTEEAILIRQIALLEKEIHGLNPPCGTNPCPPIGAKR